MQCSHSHLLAWKETHHQQNVVKSHAIHLDSEAWSNIYRLWRVLKNNPLLKKNQTNKAQHNMKLESKNKSAKYASKKDYPTTRYSGSYLWEKFHYFAGTTSLHGVQHFTKKSSSWQLRLDP